MGPGAPECSSAASGGERDGMCVGSALGQGESQPGVEAVAGSIGVVHDVG